MKRTHNYISVPLKIFSLKYNISFDLSKLNMKALFGVAWNGAESEGAVVPVFMSRVSKYLILLLLGVARL